MSFASYRKKNDRDISRTHCITRIINHKPKLHRGVIFRSAVRGAKIIWYNIENPGFIYVCQMYFDIFPLWWGNKQCVYSRAYNIALCYHPRDPLFWHAPSTPVPTWYYFTNGLSAQNRHLVIILFAVVLFLMIQSTTKMHMTWQLSHRDMDKVVTWSDHCLQVQFGKISIISS